MWRILLQTVCYVFIPLLIAAGVILLALGWQTVDSIHGSMSIENARIFNRGLFTGLGGCMCLLVAHLLYARTTRKEK